MISSPWRHLPQQEACEESQGSFPLGSGLQACSCQQRRLACKWRADRPPAKGELPCHSNALRLQSLVEVWFCFFHIGLRSLFCYELGWTHILFCIQLIEYFYHKGKGIRISSFCNCCKKRTLYNLSIKEDEYNLSLKLTIFDNSYIALRMNATSRLFYQQTLLVDLRYFYSPALLWCKARHFCL